MNILALDLATLTGWAHSCGESGCQDFALRRGDSPGMRYLALGGWLSRVYEDRPFDLVAYEQPHYRGGHATEVLAGMVARVQEFTAQHGIEITSRHTAEVKKHATGKGNANKPEMVAAAVARWPADEIIDDNHADALWLLDLVQRELGAAPAAEGG